MSITIDEALELCELEHPGRLPAHISCPFHDEQTPSCHLWDDRYWCFGCGKGGSALDFVASYYHVDYKTAWKLANRSIEGLEGREAPARREPVLCDFDLIFANDADSGGFNDEALAFIERKWPHLSPIRLYGHGVRSTRWSLLIPHRDHEGIIRGIKTRSLTTGDKKAYAGSCFTTRLYRVQGAYTVSPHSSAVLVEGESDCWTMVNHYVGSGIGVMVYALPSGAGCWKKEFARELRKHRQIHIFLDNDDAGERAFRAVINDLEGKQWARHFVPDEFNDVTEAVIGGWTPPELPL